MVNSILIVGSLMAIGSKGSGVSTSQIESPISKPSIPTSAQISPEATDFTFSLPRPVKTCSSLIFCFLMLPSGLTSVIIIPSRSSPR